MSSILASAADAAHSAAVSLATTSQVKVGASLPTVAVKEDGPDKSITLHDVPGKILIVGVPAAFSPSCSNQAPGYIEHYEKFSSKGVSQIYVLAVNDAFVMKAWKAKLVGENTTSVHFVADDKGAFTSALGLVFDASAFLGGPRAKRFAIVADGGKVQKIIVEEDPTQVTVTGAEAVLATL